MQRKLRVVKPGDGYVTRRNPVSVGSKLPPGDHYPAVLRRLGNSEQTEEEATIANELHDIRVELKHHGELFERIAVALEKLASK